jgi:hypothetical protein
MEKQKKTVLKARDKQAIVNYYKFTKEATEHGVKKNVLRKTAVLFSIFLPPIQFKLFTILVLRKYLVFEIIQKFQGEPVVDSKRCQKKENF